MGSAGINKEHLLAFKEAAHISCRTCCLRLVLLFRDRLLFINATQT